MNRRFLAFRIPFLLACLVGPADAALVWEHLTASTAHNLQVDAHGRLWIVDLVDGLRMYEGQGSQPSAKPDEGAWREFLAPPGYVVRSVAVTSTDTLYVCCNRLDDSRHTVFRRDLAGAGAVGWEELPVPAPYGLLMTVASDAADRIWVGGERGEVFRLQNSRWTREMLPTPLHCEMIRPATADILWVRAHARGQVWIGMRSGGQWRSVLSTDDNQRSDLLFVDARTAVIRIETRLVRVDARYPGASAPWIDLGTRHVAVESATSAWAIRDGRLLHVVGNDVRDCGDVPFLPDYVWWRGGHFIVASAGGVWRLVEGSEAPWHPRPLGLEPRQSAALGAGTPSYGLAALRLAGRPHIYMTRHTSSDAVLPVGSDSTMQTWLAVSKALGLEARDENLSWGESYEMSVAVADLNADRCEDVVLSTMHDGSRLLRNIRDRRLLTWTRESGLLAYRHDVAEDIDLLDADSDGDLDLYVSNLQGSDRLCLNDGAGHFVDVLPASGITSPFASTAALCRDLDSDGDTDIAVSTCGWGVFLHENLGPAGTLPRFQTRAILAPLPHPEVPTGLATTSYTGIEAADFDNDGLFDLIIGGRTQPTIFLWNLGDMEFEEDPAVFADGPPPPKVAGVVALDPDADGDWDLALTGSGGSRFLQNIDGRLGHRDEWGHPGLFANRRYSTGSILMDLDQDLDLDYVEVFLDVAPVLYLNTNVRRPLSVVVRGPQVNASAVGARVEIMAAGTARRVVAPQEISGGSGYASHRTKDLVFGGLHADSLYDVTVHLPGGRHARLDGVPGRGQVVVDMAPGFTGRIADLSVIAVTAWKEPWSRAYAAVVILSTALVAVFAMHQRQRLGIAFPWLGVVCTPVVVIGIRKLFPLDPGGMPVFASGLGGLAAGFLSVGFARARPRPMTTTLLADLARSLRVFEHNHTPRKIVDRVLLMRANLPSRADDWTPVIPLLREDLALFGAVVVPELALIVEGVRSVGIDHAVGSECLKRIRAEQRRLLLANDAAWTSLTAVRSLDALLAATDAFRNWVAGLHRLVDGRLATNLRPFISEYVASRAAVHPVDFAVEVPDVTVRLPAPEFARVVDILLENAVRAAGGHRVAFRIAADAAVGQRLVIRLADDGPGVPEALRLKLFDAGVTGHVGGTGYGLYAAKRTLEHFGGRIELARPRNGACFEIELGVISNLEA